MMPPCSRMIFCETGSPSPVPREPLDDAKIWKIESISDSSMPTPLSETRIRAVEVSASHSLTTFTRRVRVAFGGIDRVGHDVQHGAVDPSGSTMTRGMLGAGRPVELDAQLLGARLHQLDHVADGLVQVRGLERGLAILREREHVHDQVVDLGLVLLDDRPAAADDGSRPSR